MRHELPAHGISHGLRPVAGVYLRVTFGSADPSAEPVGPRMAEVQAASEAFDAETHATYVVRVGRATRAMRVDFEMAERVDEAATIARLDDLASTQGLALQSFE